MPATPIRSVESAIGNSRGGWPFFEPPATEASIAKSRGLFSEILEQFQEGFSVFSQTGRLIAWNSQFIELLDLPRDLKKGTLLADIQRLQAARGDFGTVDTPSLDARLKSFFQHLPLTTERTTPAGQVIQIRRWAMKSGDIITFYKDITEQKSAETRKNLALAEAEIASKSKSEFLAHMSHELRTPLNAIIGFSELLTSGLLGALGSDKSLEYIRDIYSSGRLLLDIVNDVLDMSKIESGKLELIFENIVVQQAICEVKSIVDELASRRNLKIVLDVPVHELVVFADERAFKQIILNLLSNAIKFSEEGRDITVRAACERQALLLSVEDRGIGMTPEETKRALQPFAQASATTTRTYGGTGLGLPIVKGLVEAHRGSLTVESTSGKGTVVRVVLPCLADPNCETPTPLIVGDISP
ncbi:MAG TPA: ATP-binding protein [Bradyrhizobium sp.]|nr:ATP-binding protein [Bradyrhizobium sp.]